MLRFLVLGFLCVGSFGFVARPPVPDNRIVGGVETTIEAHPHQIRLHIYGEPYCGGSIIGRSWVITAAHCLGGGHDGMEIQAGSKFPTGGEFYTIFRTRIHPLYDLNGYDYDIGLIQIVGEFSQSKTINQIALATVELDANTMVNVTGWGSTEEGSGTRSKVLMQVSVPIVSRKSCEQMYSGMYTVTERMICTGFEEGGKDACKGDSGGPLTADNVLYGIVSWSYGCGRPKYPGVYVNIVAMRPWIKSITGI